MDITLIVFVVVALVFTFLFIINHVREQCE